MTITDELRSDHRAFAKVLDEVEAVLPKVTTIPEAMLLTEIIRGFLNKHGQQEDDFLYPALDHILANDGSLDQMFQEHREVDAQIDNIATARTIKAARAHLRQVIRAIRNHFANEERLAFPLVERCLSSEALTRLEVAASRVT